MLTAPSQERFSLVRLGPAQTGPAPWAVKPPGHASPPLFSASIFIFSWPVSCSIAGLPRPDSNSGSETLPQTPEVGDDPMVGSKLVSSSFLKGPGGELRVSVQLFKQGKLPCRLPPGLPIQAATYDQEGIQNLLLLLFPSGKACSREARVRVL